MSHTKCIVCLQKSAEIPPEYLQFSNKLLINFLKTLPAKIDGFESRIDVSFPFCCHCRVYLAKFAKLDDKLASLIGNLCRLEENNALKIRKISSVHRQIIEHHNNKTQERLLDSGNVNHKGERNVENGLATPEIVEPSVSGNSEVEIIDNAETSCELNKITEIIEVIDEDTDATSNSKGFQSNDQPLSGNAAMNDKIVSSDEATGRGGKLGASQGRWVSNRVEQVSEKDFMYQGKYPFEQTDSGFKCGTCAAIIKFTKYKTSDSWCYMITHIKWWHLDYGRTRKQKIKQRFSEIAPDRFQYGIHVFEKSDNKWRCLACDHLVTIGQGKYKFKYISFHLNTKHENPGKHHMCELCGTRLSNSTSLKRHMITQHDESNASFPCSSCEKTFKTELQARDHEKSVHSERCFRYICEICGQKFKSKPRLQGHIGFLHNGERTFKCKDCGKAYATLSGLSTHQNSRHTGERKYICDLCGMNFAQAYSIKRHKMTAHKN